MPAIDKNWKAVLVEAAVAGVRKVCGDRICVHHRPMLRLALNETAMLTRLYERLSGCNTVKGNLERMPKVQVLIPKGVKTILDVGGSDGQTSEYFLKAGYEPTVLNIDADKVDLCAAKGLPWIMSDMHWIDAADESFDLVFISHAFEYTPMRLKEGAHLYA